MVFCIPVLVSHWMCGVLSQVKSGPTLYRRALEHSQHQERGAEAGKGVCVGLHGIHNGGTSSAERGACAYAVFRAQCWCVNDEA